MAKIVSTVITLLFRDNSTKYTKYNSAISIFIIIGYLIYITSLFTPFSSCSEKPAWKHDYGYYFTNVKNATSIIKTTFRPSWYNPDISAGRIEVQAPGSRIMIIPNLILPIIPTHILFNLGIFLCLISLPLLLARSLILFGINRENAISGAALYCLMIAGSSIGQEYVNFGHFSFMLASTLSLLAAAYLYRYLQKKKISDLIIQSLIAGLTLWSHVLIVPFIFLLYLATISSHFKEIRLKDCLLFTLFFIIFTIGPNFFWAWHFIVSLILTELERSEHTKYLQTFGSSNSFRFDLMFITMLILGMISFLRWFKNSKKYFPYLLPLLILSFYGSQLGFNNLEPARYQLTVIIVSVMLTTLLWSNLQFIIKTIFIILTTSTIITPIFPENHSMGCGFDSNKKLEDVFRFINNNLDHKSRLLVQDSWDNSHCTLRYLSLIPHLTEVPILSEPFVSTAYFTQFVDNKIFRQDINSISQNELNKNLKLYNVGYILAFSESAKHMLSRLNNMNLIYTNPPFMMYKVINNLPSYCLDCRANITFNTNAINVNNTSSDNFTILKFHYSPLLKVFPKTVTISPVCIGQNERGFIKINHGPIKSFSVVMNNNFMDIRNNDKICR